MRAASKHVLFAVTLGLMLGFAPLAAHAQTAPDAIRNYNQGIEAYSNGNTGEALKRFQAATRIDPDYSDAYYNMGSIYYQTRNYEMARDMFARAVSLSPTDGHAKYNLALTYEKLMRYEDAVNTLKQIAPGDPRFQQAKVKISELTPKIQQAAQPANPLSNAANRQPTPGVRTNPAQTVATQPNLGQTGAGNAAGQGQSILTKPLLQTFSKGYDGPTGIAIGPGGFMYVANYSKNLIYRVGANGDKTVFTQGDMIKGPIGLAFNPRSNELYVANYLLGNVVKVGPNGKSQVLVAGLNKPYNLFMDTVNNALYISEQESNTIAKVVLP